MHMTEQYDGEPIPPWDLTDLERRSCIVCGSDSHEVVCVRPDHLAVARCTQCGAMFVPCIPSAGQLANFYQQYSVFKPYLNEAAKPFTRNMVQATKHWLASTQLWGVARRVLMRPSALHVSMDCEILMRTGSLLNKTVLELGPGKHGGLLPELQAWGAAAVAVEVDPLAADAVRRIGIPVFPELSSVPSAVAHIAYASMVLEHLADPGETLRCLRNALSPAGRLLIRVPNAGEVAARGPNWIGFRVDLEHLNYFDERSLVALLDRCGFHTECTWNMTQPMLPPYRSRADRAALQQDLSARAHREVKLGMSDPFEQGTYTLIILARR